MPVDNGCCPQHRDGHLRAGGDAAHARLMSLHTAHEPGGGTRDRSARAFCDVSGYQASLVVGVAGIVVPPRPLGRAQEHPSGHAARGAGCAVVTVRLRRAVLAGPPTRPAAQRRGLPRRLLRPDQDPSALRALRCGSNLGPVVPRAFPAPEQSSLPDGPGEWVAGHRFRSSLPYRRRLPFREGPDDQRHHHSQGQQSDRREKPGTAAEPRAARGSRCRQGGEDRRLAEQIGERAEQPPAATPSQTSNNRSSTPQANPPLIPHPKSPDRRPPAPALRGGDQAAAGSGWPAGGGDLCVAPPWGVEASCQQGAGGPAGPTRSPDHDRRPDTRRQPAPVSQTPSAHSPPTPAGRGRKETQ